MIGSTRRVAVYAYRAPVDMRKSFNTLTALVEQDLKRDVLLGELFLFVSKTRRRAKVLFWDGTGLCLFANQPSSHYTSFGSRRGSWFRRCDA